MALKAEFRNRLSIPVVGSPMFIVSNPDLVIAQCKAGIVGSFPALNARPASMLDEWLKKITTELDTYNQANPEKPAAPFAVNQIVHRTNPRLEEDLALCVKYKVPIVITSLGSRPEVYEAVHSYGGVVFHDVIDNTFARKAADKGADGIIAVAAGAGGHAGTWSPFALVQEIREWFDGPLLLAGAIATGDAILAAEAMGADLAYIGSPFISTREANAEDSYKQMIVNSGASDITYTDRFTGVHGNYLTQSLVAAGIDPKALQAGAMNDMDFGAALKEENKKAWKDIWSAGQGVGAIKDSPPAAEYIARLKAQYDAARQRLAV